MLIRSRAIRPQFEFRGVAHVGAGRLPAGSAPFRKPLAVTSLPDLALFAGPRRYGACDTKAAPLRAGLARRILAAPKKVPSAAFFLVVDHRLGQKQPMLYTQKQIREELGIPQQTYRYWASVVPSLGAKKGKAAVLTYGDVLALAFTKQLCDRFGLRIGNIAPALEALFKELNSRSWVQLENSWLRITSSNTEILSTGDIRNLSNGEDAIFIECAPVLSTVRSKMLAISSEQQLSLSFGPQEIRASR